MTAVPWSDVAARLRPFVARRVPSNDIDDVVQDVLVRMHRGLPDLQDNHLASQERFARLLEHVAPNRRGDVVDALRELVSALEKMTSNLEEQEP